MARSKTKLKIRCTSSDCGSGLHCFKVSEELVKRHKEGACRECGIKLVDWERVHSRNTRDVENTFAMLKYELIRHHFWHIPLSQRAVNHSRRKGRKELRKHVKKRLSTAIGPAHPWHDGTQTTMADNATRRSKVVKLSGLFGRINAPKPSTSERSAVINS